MPLNLAPVGVPLRLVRVYSGRGLVARLASMGLVPGASIRLLSGDRGGPVVLDVKGTRVAIGRGMAHKIFVEV